jgi:thiol-disulfide isomerase/thioredoxin
MGKQVSASDFDGQIWLVNFWATWCAPCVEEMPMLSDLQLEYADKGVRILGIALDDPGRAREFAENMSLQYPTLVGQADVAVTGRRYGNSTGMLPFSVLIDAAGIIRWTHLGALDREELQIQIQALL